MSGPKKDRRAPVDEQPVALAEAEAAGVLPEVDRRDLLATVPEGSTLTKTGYGWVASVVIPGAMKRLHGEGATPHEAVAAAE